MTPNILAVTDQPTNPVEAAAISSRPFRRQAGADKRGLWATNHCRLTDILGL